jgi:ABC-type transport system substrate-binding protein
MNFADTQVDTLLDDYKVATDPNRRRSLMARLQRVLNEKAPAIFLVNDEKTYAYSSRYRLPPGTVDPFYFFTYVGLWWLNR